VPFTLSCLFLVVKARQRAPVIDVSSKLRLLGLVCGNLQDVRNVFSVDDQKFGPGEILTIFLLTTGSYANDILSVHEVKAL
jgi:hypothetical protein